MDLPPLGYATAEATVLRWLKQPGAAVIAREPLVELAAEKAIQVLGAPHSGTLLAVYAPAGAILATGAPLGWIGSPGEVPPAVAPHILGWEPEIAPKPAGLVLDVPGPEERVPPPTVAEPHARAKADRELLRRGLRHFTAQRMDASWHAPKVDLFAEVDFTRVQAHRQALKAAGGESPSYNVYIAHAVVRAFQALPHLNLHFRDGQLRPAEGIHVGIAVALGDNLVTVSLKHLAGVPVVELQRRFKGLLKKALSLTLAHEELFGSSLTVTNLGEYDVTAFAALLNPPEVFILAIGAVEERAVVREGQVVPRLMCTFCLSFDHRSVDGAPASQLLQQIKRALEGFAE